MWIQLVPPSHISHSSRAGTSMSPQCTEPAGTELLDDAPPQGALVSPQQPERLFRTEEVLVCEHTVTVNSLCVSTQ